MKGEKMKLIIETVYDNIDQDWLDWYCDRLDIAEVPIDISKFKIGLGVSFSSKDPTSEVIATTSYGLIK